MLTFVSGSIVATVLTIWNAACSAVRMPFCPVIMMTGIPPRWAYAAPVARLSAPGPKVVSTTPGLPVSRP